jgi:hypothetical protein
MIGGDEMEVYHIEYRLRQASLKREIGAIIGKDSGKLRRTIKGGKDFVFMNHNNRRAAKGNIFTHNHPGDIVSFSFNDLDWACATQVAEMRVVTYKYLYSIRPDGWTWNERAWEDQIKPAISLAAEEVFALEYDVDSFMEYCGGKNWYCDECYRLMGGCINLDDVAWTRIWREVGGRTGLQFRKAEFVVI